MTMLTNQCAILIGGAGTRLGALTRETPKPLLPVNGVPFLDILVGEAVRRGFTDIVLLAGFRPDVVAEYAGGLQSRLPSNCRVRVSIEPEPLGTGGAVRYATDFLADTFLLLNGDTWFDFNWLDLLTVARDGCAVAARHVDDARRHESLNIALDGSVTSIVPRAESATAAMINGGVYTLNKKSLRDFPEHFSIEGDLLPRLIEGKALRGREYSGFFIDIGIPETFEAAQTVIPSRRRRPAIFFDRDGVLNHDDNYVGSIDRFRWIDGAREAVRLANERGYYVFVVTNQAGVARGLYDEAAVESLHCWMAGELRASAAWVDDWRYCPFHPEGSVERYRAVHPWRKPAPGMILDLLDKWPVDKEGSILIGDHEGDCVAARAAGILPFQFDGGNLCDFVMERLPLVQRSEL
jgi:D-glycero-D-manno-heptose 1,7-bisphosphate phosphatase